ncbi:GDP-L-fucose synthase family protein [Patescibacteria group bacterium]
MNLKNKKILVTGGAGFLGKFVVEKLVERGVPLENITVPRSKEIDLRILENCIKIVKDKDIVIHLAANAGGIGYNKENPGKLFYDNLIMGTHLMEASRLAGIEKFVAMGTICSYPKLTPVPFKESNLWAGYPEETNAPYGLAKKMMLVQAQAYRQQYNFNAICLLTVNLYGPRDTFDPKRSHVIPALIEKIYKAKQEGNDFIEVWGTGNVTREFLYAEDAAEGIVLATEKYNNENPVNIGSGHEVTIKDVVKQLTELMKFKGEIRWVKTQPDGQPRRMLDTSLAEQKFGFKAKMSLTKGLQKTIDWYIENYQNPLKK